MVEFTIFLSIDALTLEDSVKHVKVDVLALGGIDGKGMPIISDGEYHTIFIVLDFHVLVGEDVHFVELSVHSSDKDLVSIFIKKDLVYPVPVLLISLD